MVVLRMCILLWRIGRGVVRMVVMLCRGGEGETQHHRDRSRHAERGREVDLHASILTSRIIPASMWYSRWQWKAQRPNASARTR